LPNPNALTIKGNGTKLDDYDGSEAVEINITPANIGAAASSHGTHVSYSTTAPKANGTASAGSASTVARSDHVHPLQTTISGNAGSASKLNSAVTISLTGAVTGSVEFDGSANVSLATTANHTHSYAGSSSAGGAATSANKLNTDAGSTNVPVYFENGIPKAITAYSGKAGSTDKLATGRSLVVGLANVSSNSNKTSFDGSKNLDGSDASHPTIPITGTLGVGHGGTGKTTLTKYGIVYGNAESALGVTSAGSAGFILTGGGSSAAPSWTDPSSLTAGKASSLASTIHLLVTLGTASTTGLEFNGSADAKTIPITGTLGVGHGGTGATTLTANGVLYGGGTNAISALSPGSSGAVLTSGGTNAAPTWTAQSNLAVGSAAKLTSARTIALAVASGANGGVTGSVSTSLDGNVTINTTLSSHTHGTGDITSGVLSVARGGTGYGSIDTTPTSGSDKVVKSSGVHKRIAYKKITLSTSGWSNAYRDTMNGNATTYRQAITTGNDITAATEIVSVKLEGSMADSTTTYNYTDTFTGDGSTKTFTLSHAPTSITSVTRGGVSVSSGTYSFSGTTFTITEAPNTGTALVVNYAITYDNDIEYCKLKDVESGASLIEFRAHTKPMIDLTLVVGYVSETLETLTSQAALPNNERYTTAS